MPVPSGERGIHVLAIEDNPADVELLRRALIHASVECRLTVLEDGAKAIDFFRKLDGQAGEDCPDLTVLDLNLPKSDGIEVLEAVRTSRVGSQIPIVVLSSSPSSLERGQLEPYRIDQYIVKPADLDEYLAIGLVLKTVLDGPRPLRSVPTSTP